MTSPIRVLLVDDHTLFRSGVRALLARQAEIDVVGEAENGPEGVKLAASLNPDVVLLDLNMPGLSGVETLQLLLQDAPQRAVVMLTVSEDADDLARALRAGARGYLLKNINADFLVNAIRRAADGESVMSEAMTAKLMAQFRQGGASRRRRSAKPTSSPRASGKFWCSSPVATAIKKSPAPWIWPKAR